MILQTIANAFREGGWGMYPTLAFGLWAFTQAIKDARRDSYRATKVLALTTFFAGSLGTLTGLIKTLSYAAEYPLDEKFKFLFLGASESMHCLGLALVCLIVTSLVVAIGSVASQQKR